MVKILCTNCFPYQKHQSTQIELYVLYKRIIMENTTKNTKDIIKPYEIDIAFTRVKVRFEFNGVFWHSDKFKDTIII
jgi:hypothetical protein